MMLLFPAIAAFNHIKPHGALYNLSAKNKKVAKTIAQGRQGF